MDSGTTYRNTTTRDSKGIVKKTLKKAQLSHDLSQLINGIN